MAKDSQMPGTLQWPYRIILYVILYIVWTMIALVVLAYYPAMTYDQAITVLPAGWGPIAAAFLLDFYFNQVRAKRRPHKGQEVLRSRS